MTVTPIPHSSNTTLHPALHNVTTDTSECDDIPGMTCPVLAPLGNSGRSSSRLCVEVSLVPSGIVTVMGFVATDIPVADASVTKKWLVAPESNIAQSLISSRLKLIVFKMLLAACAYPYLLGLI